MSLADFIGDPWKKSHPSYEESPFAIRPAPEYANSEVVIASLYRSIGFGGVKEASIPKSGRDFDKTCQDAKKFKSTGLAVSQETWRTVLMGVLESPKLPNQSGKRFLQLSPIVPDTGLYSGSARLAGQPWNPGALVQRVVLSGCEDMTRASRLWHDLFEGLSVAASDDAWARWLQASFEGFRREGTTWSFQALDGTPAFAADELKSMQFPARQFVDDLEAIIDAKPAMTRRQWISLLESILRLGTAMHVLWLCGVNDWIWQRLRSAIKGYQSGGASLATETAPGAVRSPLVLGNPAVPAIRSLASRYLSARLGINLVLWRLQQSGAKTRGLAGWGDVDKLVADVKARRVSNELAGILEQFQNLEDEQPRTLACKRGIGSNIVEFERHVLGQRQTANELLRGYDQGYVLRKRGEHSSAPWIVSPGPVAVLALVHSCLHKVAGPRSVTRLCEHLGRYGIDANPSDISKSDLGRMLRMLGLVLDSPDAEGGMLLVPPFGKSARESQGATA